MVRIPLVGGVNDDEENITATARFVASLPGQSTTANLLPYHKIAMTKYAKLGRGEEFHLLEEPEAMKIKRAVEIFKEFGVEASVGG